MSDADWHFEWPSGYVRYRDGKREVWQDSYGPADRLRLTDAEREAVEASMIGCVNERTHATLRGLLERME